MSHRCILWGGYAHGNVGDDLTLAVALHDARREFGESVGILTPKPSRTARQFPGAAIVPYVLRRPPRPVRWWMRLEKFFRRFPGVENGREPRYRWKDQVSAGRSGRSPWIETVERAQVVVLVGGGYLTDLFPLEVYLFPVEAARAAGVAIRTGPLGIGPITSSRSAARLAAALGSAAVVVRDAVSCDFCRRNGIAASVRPDAGFRVREVMTGLERSREGAAVGERREVAVCATVQEGSGNDAVRRRLADWWARLVRALSDRKETVLSGLCFHSDPSKDLSFTREAFRRAGFDPDLVVPPREDFRDAIRDLARKDAVVTARFHAAVVAGALSVPCVAIARGAYSAAKMRSVEEHAVATTRSVDPAAVEPDAAARLMETMLFERSKRPPPS